MCVDIYLSAGMTAPGQGSEDVRQLLSALYNRTAGGSMPALLKMPGGKPYFKDSPWHLSLTHTKKLAACSLGLVPMGLDAESLSRQVSPKLSTHILSEKEYTWYECRGSSPRDLLSLWVLKESYVKFTGQGISGDLRRFSFSINGTHAVLSGSPLQFTLEERANHILALCTEKRPHCHWL